MFGSDKPSTRPVLKVCRWRNSRADFYAVSFDGKQFFDQAEFEAGICTGRIIPVWGDGSLDESSLDGALGDGYVLPPALQEIISQIPVNPQLHQQYLEDKAFEKRINEPDKK